MQTRRTAPRIETDLGFISCSSDISSYSRITNMSTTGTFIRTERPLPVNTELDLHLQLPDDPEVISVDGRVVWSKPVCSADEANMGIQFTNILPKHKKKLSDFIKQNRRRACSSTSASAWL
jgi:uncharacterized protein (TIGR02266 family)